MIKIKRDQKGWERGILGFSRLIPMLQRLIGDCKGGSEGKVKLARGSEVSK